MSDKFLDTLRDSLADYEVPVSPSLWRRVERRLTLRVWLRRTVWTVVAACVAVAVLLVAPPVADDTVATIAPMPTVIHRGVSAAPSCGELVTGGVGLQTYDSEGAVTGGVDISAYVCEAPDTADVGNVRSRSEIDERRSGDLRPQSQSDERRQECLRPKSQSDERRQECLRPQSQPLCDGHRPSSAHKHDAARPRSALALYGSGVPSSSTGNGVPVAASDAATPGVWRYDNGPTVLAAPMSSVPLRTVRHHTPLRYGLAVRYALGPRWGVESGVRLTVLRSTFTEQPSQFVYDQTAYYVGVPLTATCEVARWRRLAVYASAGAEIAKCVAATDEIDTPLAKPWQVSLEAAAGAQIDVTPGLAVYAEPGVAYHFRDGSSLETAFSKQRTAFTIAVGVRVAVNGK